ncbi:MAG: FmdB family transcriptional regulator [Chloroflexi bacterium]|jgi:predicted nucleic acid-binding Zn ribbon protein|nr:FmdB family transcriptional regulator [Chloroflexota bacterium]|tara:strand:- start:1875 stop:2150 length:276 start_codon:yes stop_codon:yes gene_type:complete
MPTYEFKNKKTGEIEEYLLSFSQVDDFKKDNPHLERIWTDTPSVIYKGSGFYSTDYKSTPKSKSSKNEKKDSSDKKNPKKSTEKKSKKETK